MMQVTKTHIAIVMLLFAMVVLYFRERENRIHAEDSSAALKTAQQYHDAAIQKRESDLFEQEQQIITAQKAMTPATAREIVTKIVTIPGAPVEPLPVVSRDAFVAEVAKSLPDAPSYSVLTEQQTVDLAKYKLSCDLTQSKLYACSANAVDYRAEVQAANQRADVLEKALKGGTVLQRIWRVVKPVGCAVGGAAAGAYVKGVQGAAIGGTAAGTLCAVAF